VTRDISSHFKALLYSDSAQNLARPLRLELENGLYHVTSRGDRREDIYVDDEDRVA